MSLSDWINQGTRERSDAHSNMQPIVCSRQEKDDDDGGDEGKKNTIIFSCQSTRFFSCSFLLWWEEKKIILSSNFFRQYFMASLHTTQHIRERKNGYFNCQIQLLLYLMFCSQAIDCSTGCKSIIEATFSSSVRRRLSVQGFHLLLPFVCRTKRKKEEEEYAWQWSMTGRHELFASHFSSPFSLSLRLVTCYDSNERERDTMSSSSLPIQLYSPSRVSYEYDWCVIQLSGHWLFVSVLITRCAHIEE